MKDPSGGTTGRVKPYGARGVDGRSRRIQLWGGITAPTHSWSPKGWRTFKIAGDFFTLWTRIPGRNAYCPAGAWLSPESVFSDAMVATGGLRARMPGNSFGSEAFSPVFIACLLTSLGGADTATGIRVSVVTARTAAKASASPAPNRSSRPGEPRSRAVRVRA